MAVGVEFDADHSLRTYERTHALEEVALAVVIPMSHHRAVQIEKTAVDRQRRLELPEDFVAHALVGITRGGTAGLCGVTGAFDQLEPVAPCRRARCRDRAGLM